MASIFMFLVCIIPFVGWWRVFVKAGHSGWKCLIPIYNIIIFLRIIKRPDWWIVLYIFGFFLTVFLPPILLIFYTLDAFRLNTVFGQNESLYNITDNMFDRDSFRSFPFSANTIYSAFSLGFLYAWVSIRGLIYFFFGFPFIAFNSNAIYCVDYLNRKNNVFKD